MHRIAMLAILVFASPAFADDTATPEPNRRVDKGAIGVGIILGEPLGICAKLYLRDDRAVQAAIGSALIANGYQAHADYVLHPWVVQERDLFVMPIYLGPGFRFIDYTGGSGGSSHAAFGLRAVIGLLFDFKSVPLDAFVEVAGVFEYDTGTDKGFGAGLNAGAGLRYYF